MKKQLLIIGGGFAGFWAAMSAIRQSREIGKQDEVEIILVNKDNYFTIRPRLYEVSLDGVRISLDHYCKPLGINLILGEVERIDPDKNEATVFTVHGVRTLHYDYVILATGGTLKAVNIPGIEYTQNIDVFDNAQRLEDHIVALAKNDFAEDGASTVIVAGAGFTGLEAVTSIEEKLIALRDRYSSKKTQFNVILIDRGDVLGGFFSPEGQRYIADACANKNIEVIAGTEITAIEPSLVHLANGQSIPSRTVIWTVGMVASSLTQFFKGERDNQNRLMVDTYLKLPGYDNVIIAGDVANVSVDNGHTAVMACQYTQFMGRWAGHNAINDMFGIPVKEYIQNGYATCLDLGLDHALYTTGWERTVDHSGYKARETKKQINTVLLYPNENIEATLVSSKPEIPQF